MAVLCLSSPAESVNAVDGYGVISQLCPCRYYSGKVGLRWKRPAQLPRADIYIQSIQSYSHAPWPVLHLSHEVALLDIHCRLRYGLPVMAFSRFHRTA